MALKSEENELPFLPTYPDAKKISQILMRNRYKATLLPGWFDVSWFGILNYSFLRNIGKINFSTF